MLEDEEQLVERVVALASQYGRQGYRRITALLQNKGWCCNHKRLERIWRQEGLKVPGPERKDHVWSYDMAIIRTTDGRALRILVIIDEYTRECLSMHVARSIKHQDVLDQLYELFLRRGTPEYIRSDNAPEFTLKL
jgi:putative transposase